MDYAERIDSLEEYIQQAERTASHAKKHGAVWLARSCRREIQWASQEQTRLYEKLMKENGKYGG